MLALGRLPKFRRLLAAIASLLRITEFPRYMAYGQVNAGGLMSYGPNVPELYRQAEIGDTQRRQPDRR